METVRNRTGWARLAKWLGQQSRDICKMNGCTADDHKCESYAYISQDGDCHDVCISDYWRGWSSRDEETHGKLAAIALPWSGCGRDLRQAVDNECDLW